MINLLRIENFKCFTKQEIRLAPLTVLTGENASGKSSVLQVFGLLQQSWIRTFEEGFFVKGDEIQHGTCGDILNMDSDEKTLAFEFDIDGSCVCAKFSASSKEYKAPLISLTDNNGKELVRPNLNYSDSSPPEKLQKLWNTIKSLQFITADRIGPRDTHDIGYSGPYDTVGVRGERAVWFLNKHKNQTIEQSPRKYEEATPTLPKQLEAWMAEIFPGFKLDVQPILGTDMAALSLASEGTPEFVRPKNTGFGLSYTLPIYVACLAAKEGELVLIENPEAHLHPAAQSKLASFLAKVATSGVQIIVETHSDHIINGIRKAVLSETLNRDKAIIHYFRQKESDEFPKVTTIEVDKRGNLSDWPKGFFDQLDEDFETLTTWGE